MRRIGLMRTRSGRPGDGVPSRHATPDQRRRRAARGRRRRRVQCGNGGNSPSANFVWAESP